MSSKSSSSFKPTAPSLTKRYNKLHRIEPQPAHIPAALFTHAIEPEPQYLPQGWSSCIHPEGQIYFARDFALKVVTEENIHDVDTLNKVLQWTDEIVSTMAALSLPQSNNVELFLELDEDDESCCFYYLVDHSTRVTFWLEPVPTALLDLSPVVSPSHLKLALEELYWNHVEYFPTQLDTPNIHAINELISVFTHAQADAMTSEYSTFPYTAKQSASFLKLLRPYQGIRPDAHILCLTARLWGVIASHRFSTHYGQEQCRLSRDQNILANQERSAHWLQSALSRLLFGFPAKSVDSLENLYVDQIIYVHHWRKFMTAAQKDRKLFVSWSFASMMTSMLLMMFSIGCHGLAVASIVAAYGSILSGLVLFVKQQNLAEANAAEAATYMHEIRHEKYGFQSTGLLFSLPKAFLFWSILLFIPQVPMITAQFIGLLPAVLLTLGFCFVCVFVRMVESPLSFSLPGGSPKKDIYKEETDLLTEIV